MRLKFSIAFCLALLCFATLATAQITKGNDYFQEGQVQLNAGIGLLPTYYSHTSKVLPPVSVSAEMGISNTISVGGFLGVSTGREEWWGGDINYSFIIIGARGSYHFGIFDKMDTYAGLMLGYNIVSANYDDRFYDNSYDYSAAASAMTLSAYVGARYQLKEKLSLFGELGYGISVLNLGVSFKLK